MIIKRSLALLSVAAMLTLYGCSSSEPKTDPESTPQMQTPAKVEILLSTSPATPLAGKETNISAFISQPSGDPVNDAKVEMEIWREGDTDKETIPTERTADGTYSIKKTFAQKGLHHVTIHTTTSEIHQMPTVDLLVE